MIICDRCKKIPQGSKNQPFLYELIGLKQEETKAGRKGTAVGREIVKIPMHLCDNCITIVNKDLGYFVTGVRDNQTIEIDSNLDRPIGVTERNFADKGIDDPTLMANEGFVSQVK